MGDTQADDLVKRLRDCSADGYLPANVNLVCLVAADAIQSLQERVKVLEQQAQTKFYWLIELRPAFENHPPFMPTYYAGWMKTPVEAAQTFDVNCAPKWTSKDEAETVAAHLLPTLSCVWRAVEHGFHARAALSQENKHD